MTPLRRFEIGRPADTTVPSAEDEEPNVGVYPDWTSETTRIVKVAKDRFERWSDAREHFKAQYGRILENLSTANWWAVRVESK